MKPQLCLPLILLPLIHSPANARCTSSETIGTFRGIVNNCVYDVIAKFTGSGGYFASHEGLTGRLKPGGRSQTGVSTNYKIFWTACEYGPGFSPEEAAKKRMASLRRLSRCGR
jgi:hypothetical protein